MKTFDAIIIGSGIGGLGIGALLSSSGWKVLVLEKNKQIGGRCTSWERDGYKLDLGVHLFCNGFRGPLEEICEKSGVPRAIDWVQVTRSYLQVGDHVQKYSRRSMVEAVPPDKREAFERLFTDMFRLTDKELDELWYVPLEQYVSRFTEDPMAHTLIDSLVCQYFCVPSSVASTTEFIHAFRDVVNHRATCFPKGGNKAVPQTYASAIEKHGGEIRTEASVDSVIVENGAAVGVRMKDGSEIFCPKVISNADLRTTVLNLVGAEHFPPEYVHTVTNLTYANLPVVLKVAVSEQVSDKQLVIYVPDEHSPTLKVTKEMMAGTIPEWVAGFYTTTTNFDPSLAPGGHQVIGSLQCCPPRFDQDWARWKEVLLNNFYRVYPEAKGKVVKTWLETPGMVDSIAGEGGNIIGIGQTVDQVHERRPKAVSPLKGLYFCSAEAGGHGIGTELAARSALELFQVLK